MNEKKQGQALNLIFAALVNEHRREIIYSSSIQPSSIINAPDMEAAIELANGYPNKNGMKIFESVPM